jgi:hypothetical protein
MARRLPAMVKILLGGTDSPIDQLCETLTREQAIDLLCALDVDDKSFIAKKLYEATGNPLHVWSSYLLHRALGADFADLPEWILEYFDRVANNLFEIEDAKKRGEKIERAAVTVALEIKKPGQSGRGDFFKNFTEHPERVAIADDVYKRLYLGDKESFAIESVAQSRGVSKSTVRLAWVDAKKVFPKLVSLSHRLPKT